MLVVLVLYLEKGEIMTFRSRELLLVVLMLYLERVKLGLSALVAISELLLSC